MKAKIVISDTDYAYIDWALRSVKTQCKEEQDEIDKLIAQLDRDFHAWGNRVLESKYDLIVD